MLKRVLLLTGSPGVGKTTALTRIAGELARNNYKVGGIISREVRLNGERVGFELVNIRNSKRGWLAQVDTRSGPQVGKYYVNIRDLEEVGVESIRDAVETCEVIAIDEIGPMELFSRKFREATNLALQSQKLVLAVVHWKTRDSLVVDLKSTRYSEIFVVTVENREELVEIVASKALEYLAQK